VSVRLTGSQYAGSLLKQSNKSMKFLSSFDVQGLAAKSQEPKLPQNIVLQIDLKDNTAGIPDLQVCWQLEAQDFSNEQVTI